MSDLGRTGAKQPSRFDTIRRPTAAALGPIAMPLDQGGEAADPPSDHVEADDANTPGLVDALLEEAVSGDELRSAAADKRLKAMGRKLYAGKRHSIR